MPLHRAASKNWFCRLVVSVVFISKKVVLRNSLVGAFVGYETFAVNRQRETGSMHRRISSSQKSSNAPILAACNFQMLMVQVQLRRKIDSFRFV